MKNDTLGLYIHIPFCKAKCGYCDFNSYAGREEFIPAYFNALQEELASYAGQLSGCSIRTLYIGGGTPSYVDAKYIYETMQWCRQYFDIAGDAEISMESNPGTLSYEKLTAYKAIGINRLSIGLQACQNSILKKMGRIHSVEEFLENYGLARKAGFKNINLDLIFGLPEQTLREWSQTLDTVVGLQASHLSCYSLKIEEGTPFGERLAAGELYPAEDELDREMYRLTMDRLAAAGFQHYEISNFAREGYACRHNLIYWKAEPYIGIGAGAHSYFKESRYNNISDIGGYIRASSDRERRTENLETIGKSESMAEYMILGLRLIRGVNADEFYVRFGEDLFARYEEQIRKLEGRKLLRVDGGNLQLSAWGLDMANQVFMEFL